MYNREGRRDNKYKARIKILVKETGVDAFREKVEKEWQSLKGGPLRLTDTEIQRCRGFFDEPDYKELPAQSAKLSEELSRDVLFASWYQQNVDAHKKPGYAIVTICLKTTGVAPGDVTTEQMNFIADVADRYSFGELRISHEQNVILADIEQDALYEIWQALKSNQLSAANLGLLTDIICCPGGDFCALANAKSIPIAESIQRRFDDAQRLQDIGDISLNISGCMNACGHHHVGNIGILGVDKKGAEFYQVSLGGSAENTTSLGQIVGPSFAQDEVPDVIEKIVNVYTRRREGDERFIDTFNRLGMAPFKEEVYGKTN